MESSYAKQSSIKSKSIQEEVQNIFDQIDHPNIAFAGDYIDPILKQKRFLYLEQKYKLPIPEADSIQIIKDVLEGIVQIQSHLLIYKPCQIFKEHIIFKDNSRWGICNIICYRDPEQSPQKNTSRYWPIDYDSHMDEDSELAWSIGRMWFQMITNKTFPAISKLTQEKIDKMIDDSKLRDLRVVTLLKQILKIDYRNRFFLKDIISHQLFQFPEISKINMHSMMPSVMNQRSRVPNKNGSIQNQYNPFQEELFKRDFKESIVVAELLDTVKKWILKNYQIRGHNQQIEFSGYLIDLKSFLRLKNLEKTRQNQEYNLIVFSDKHDYTKFLYKKIELQSKLNRKRKMRKFDQFRKTHADCLCHLDDIREQSVHYNFKSYLTSYAQSLREKRIKKNPCAQFFVKLIQIIMIRCVNYIFKSCRKYIFSQFMKDGEKFQLQQILKRIEQCKDIEKLKRLEIKILDLYFSHSK